MQFLNPLSSDASYPARTVSFTGTAGTTATWPAGPQGVVITSDSACYVTVGVGVTATSSNGTYLPPYTPVAFKVNSTINTGQPWRVSAIQVAAGGSIYCTPVNES